jgi:hemin uptake protein HemP
MKVSELMGEDPVIELDHEGQIYRLRITRNRKLILTK